MIDLITALVLIGLAGLISAAYLVWSRLHGKARFQRVDQDGGSAMLGTGTMAGAYWMLEPIARRVVALGITANGVTMIALGLALLGGVALAFGHFGIAAALVTVAFLGDALDGMVARMLRSGSDAGAVLDATVDRYEEFFFLAGLAVFYRGETAWMCLSLAALLGAIMTSYASIRAEALRVKIPRGSMRRPERAVYLTLGAGVTAITSVWFAHLPRWVGHAPMLLALGVVAITANVSAVLRTRALMRAVEAPHETPPVSRPPLGRTLHRHQIGALAATGADFAAMVLAVEWFVVDPVRATVLGASIGAMVNFGLGRQWVFQAHDGRVGPQVLRYALVSGMSLGFNTLGEHVAVGHLGTPYLASRVAIALAVSLLWNFPMQRHFVFGPAETPCRA